MSDQPETIPTEKRICTTCNRAVSFPEWQACAGLEPCLPCPENWRKLKDAAPQGSQPPAGAAGDPSVVDLERATNAKWEREVDKLRTPPPQPQGGTPEVDAGDDCETCHGNTDDCPQCLGAASRGEYRKPLPTPESDKESGRAKDYVKFDGEDAQLVPLDFARTLETHRNEARAALAAAEAEVEAARAQGCPIDMSLADWFRAIDRQHIERGGHLSAALEDNAVLRAELEQTRQEVERLQAMQDAWANVNLPNEVPVPYSELLLRLTAAEERVEGLAALNQAHAEHLAAARADLHRVADERDTAIRERDEAAKDATRWQALIGCARIRVMGHAGFRGDQGNYRHIGLELWTQFSEPVGELKNATGRKVLTEFADAALAAKTTEGGV